MSNATTDKTPAKTGEATPAKAESTNPTVKVGQMIQTFMNKGTLFLPPDYSAENALKSAWLTLQTVQNLDKQPALQVCTNESIVNALLDMVVQGLNPAKKQCYFIVYGKTLTCQRSYFGDQALAERVKPGIEIYSGVIWEGDTFEFETLRGRKVVTKHVSGLENQGKAIKGAYCGIVDTTTGEDLGAEIMTIDQIKKSWSMSKTYKEGGNSPHTNFSDQMCLRTVIRRRCKGIINASSDELLLAAVRRQDDDAVVAEVGAEAELLANGEVLSLPPSDQAAPQSEQGIAADEAKPELF